MIAANAETLHRPLAAIVRAYGIPASIASKDDGQHVVFTDDTSTLDAIVGDDAIVHAFDLSLARGARYSFALEGMAHAVVFGVTTSLAARDEMAADAETEGPDFRVFRSTADTTIVLVFDRTTTTLSHLIVGDRAAILRLGYLRSPQPTQPQFGFAAPRLRHSAVADAMGTAATIVRLDLDRSGRVRSVHVIVPSADPAFDASLAERLGHDTYVPAQLGGRSIGASVFREVRH